MYSISIMHLEPMLNSRDIFENKIEISTSCLTLTNTPNSVLLGLNR